MRLILTIAAAILLLNLAGFLQAGAIGPQPTLTPASASGIDALTSSATSKTVTLATVMPDTSYHVEVMVVGAGAKYWSVDQLTTSSFNVTVSANTGTVTFTYRAVDY